LESAESNELQETTTPIDTQSDELVDSEENRIVKRHALLQPSTGHSSEEEDTTATTLDSQSDEHDDDILPVRLVKRNIPVASSEEDTTAANLLDSQSVEDDGVDSDEKRRIKRNVETTTIDHSSEEETTTVDAASDEQHDDSAEKKVVKRDIPVGVAGLTIRRRFDSSEEDTTAHFDCRSNERDYSDELHDSDEWKRIVKRDVIQTTTIDHSSEEETTTSVYSDEHDDVDSDENKIVKRNVHVETATRDRSSEEDTTPANLFDSQSIEDDGVDSEEKRRIKRSSLALTAVDHSSEENTTDGTFEHSAEDSLEDVLVRLSQDVDSLPSTALRI
jgi:hypothetical protein